jgi:hypothetical protein
MDRQLLRSCALERGRGGLPGFDPPLRLVATSGGREGRIELCFGFAAGFYRPL